MQGRATHTISNCAAYPSGDPTAPAFTISLNWFYDGRTPVMYADMLDPWPWELTSAA
jgi:hypothetical protein